MNAALQDYIKQARAKGHKDDQIKTDMVAGGWDAVQVEAGLKGEDALVVPPPPSSGHNLSASLIPTGGPGQPVAVVNNFSTRGLEYIIMFIALWVSATSLGSLLHNSVNSLLGGSADETFAGLVSFASAALIVSLPILAFLFLRLKRSELSDSSLRQDPSRKRAVQLTLVVTFIIGLGNIIFFVFNLMSGGSSTDAYNAVGSQGSSSLLGNFVHLLITLLIAGGIFAYYWHDEHKKLS